MSIILAPVVLPVTYFFVPTISEFLSLVEIYLNNAYWDETLSNL